MEKRTKKPEVSVTEKKRPKNLCILEGLLNFADKKTDSLGTAQLAVKWNKTLTLYMPIVCFGEDLANQLVSIPKVPVTVTGVLKPNNYTSKKTGETIKQIQLIVKSLEYDAETANKVASEELGDIELSETDIPF